MRRWPEFWALVRPGWAAAIGADPKRRLALLLLLLLPVGGILVFALGFGGEGALEALQRHHLSLLGFVQGTPVLAGLAFMGIYALAVATSLPGIGVLTMVGGYLLGWLPATLYVLIASIGAGSLVFVLARRALRGRALELSRPSLGRFAEGFRDNAAALVFILHLLPVFPFGVVIGLPAACGVTFRVYLVAALLGLIPGTALFARLGEGLGAALGQGTLGSGDLMTSEIMLSLSGLALLALLPLLHRGWRAWRSSR